MPSTTWKVTNATTDKKLVVINASVDSDAPHAFYYDQKTTLLPFANGSILAAGNTDSISVPDVQKDKNGFSLPFTFIVAEAETLSPVKAVTFKADLSDINDITIDDTTVSDMVTVFNFLKNITAFPGSELATEFAALDYTNDNAVTAFFTKSEDYRTVTLDTLSLVKSYYNALPYGWANGKNVTIYLYGGTYDEVSDTDEVKSIGTLTITNDWTLPLPLAVPEGFKMELKLTDDKARNVIFSDGVFWDSTRTATAKLSLAGSFAVPSQLALNDSDNNLCTFLVGKVNGMNAFGLEEVKPRDPNEGDRSFQGLFQVHSFKDGLILGMFGVGIAAGIFILVRLGQFVKWCVDHGNPTVDQKERAVQTEELKGHITNKVRTVIDEVNNLIKVPEQEEIPADQTAYTVQQLASKTKQSIQNVQKMLDAQRAQLEVLGARFSREDMQLVADRMEAVQQRVDQGTSPEALMKFRTDLSDTMDQLQVNNTTIFVAKTKLNSRLTNEERENYDRAFEAYDNIRLTQERVNEDMKDIEAGLDEREIIDEPLEPVIQ
jgi:hypothetical protein